MNVDLIHFRKAISGDESLIRQWWTSPHVIEFWDNRPEMWENCANYLKGQKDLFDYWIGFYEQAPYSLILTSDGRDDPPDYMQPYLPDEGEVRTLDFMIGEDRFLGKGFGPSTLKQFMDFQPKEVVSFLIDPAAHNTRAVHVYQKAGFQKVAEFTPDQGGFAGQLHFLMKCGR